MPSSPANPSDPAPPAGSAPLTVRALLTDSSARLEAAGVASPRVDAEFLLAHVLGCSRGVLGLAPDPTPGQAGQFLALVDQRAARVPLQYLLGTAAFRHLEVAVGPGVFVPRPETELLIDLVLRDLSAPAPIAVDLCSGSGALALALAQEAPAATVIAVERAPEALVWLRRNVTRLDPAGRVTVVAADVTDLVADVGTGALAGVAGRVDAVVCNPPYVPEGAGVGTEVGFDPLDAVFAGGDGLRLMPAVIALAAVLLRPGGVVAIEHDESQGESLPALFAAVGGWSAVAGHTDLAGRPRFVTARRSPVPFPEPVPPAG